jgi:hypothetical protein
MAKPDVEKDEDKQQRGGGDANQRNEQRGQDKREHQPGQRNRQSDQGGDK